MAKKLMSKDKPIYEMKADEIERMLEIQKIECLYCWAVAMEATPESQDWWVKTTIKKDNPLPEELDTVCADHQVELAAALLRVEEA